MGTPHTRCLRPCARCRPARFRSARTPHAPSHLTAHRPSTTTRWSSTRGPMRLCRPPRRSVLSSEAHAGWWSDAGEGRGRSDKGSTVSKAHVSRERLACAGGGSPLRLSDWPWHVVLVTFGSSLDRMRVVMCSGFYACVDCVVKYSVFKRRVSLYRKKPSHFQLA